MTNMSKGYSILELSISLIVITMLSAGALDMVRVNGIKSKVDSTIKTAHFLQKQLKLFVQDNHYLPCPANPKLATTDSNYGKASAYQYDKNDCTVKKGMIPFKTLGIMQHSIFDKWKNKFVYAIASGMGSKEDIELFSNDKHIHFKGDLKIINQYGQEITYTDGNNKRHGAAYIIASPGTYNTQATELMKIANYYDQTYVVADRNKNYDMLLFYDFKEYMIPRYTVRSPKVIGSYACANAMNIYTRGNAQQSNELNKLHKHSSSTYFTASEKDIAPRIYRAAAYLNTLCNNPPDTTMADMNQYDQTTISNITNDNSIKGKQRVYDKIGDVNGDGYADILIPMDGETVKLILGKKDLESTIDLTNYSSAITFLINNSTNKYSTAGLGDINNDGYNDFAISNRDDDVVYIITGRAMWANNITLSLSNDDISKIVSSQYTASNISQYEFGFDVSRLGDIDKDGINDFAITSLVSGTNITNVPSAHIIFAGKINWNHTRYIEVQHIAEQAILDITYSASSKSSIINSAGDLNNDGHADFTLTKTHTDTSHLLFSGKKIYDHINFKFTEEPEDLIKNGSFESPLTKTFYSAKDHIEYWKMEPFSSGKFHLYYGTEPHKFSWYILKPSDGRQALELRKKISYSKKNLITNGDFESPKITDNWGQWQIFKSINGWSSSDNKIELLSSEYSAYPNKNGQQVVELDSDLNDSEPLVQNIATTKMHSYDLSFLTSSRWSGEHSKDPHSNKVKIYWDNKLIDIVSSTSSKWRLYNYKVFANSNSTNLKFDDGAGSDHYGSLIDDVKLEKMTASISHKGYSNIYQNVNTDAGKVYNLSFDFGAVTSHGIQGLEVRVDDVTIYKILVNSLGWHSLNLRIIGDGNTKKISFVAYNNASNKIGNRQGSFLDHVRMVVQTNDIVDVYNLSNSKNAVSELKNVYLSKHNVTDYDQNAIDNLLLSIKDTSNRYINLYHDYHFNALNKTQTINIDHNKHAFGLLAEKHKYLLNKGTYDNTDNKLILTNAGDTNGDGQDNIILYYKTESGYNNQQNKYITSNIYYLYQKPFLRHTSEQFKNDFTKIKTDYVSCSSSKSNIHDITPLGDVNGDDLADILVANYDSGCSLNSVNIIYGKKREYVISQ